jgi:hypothetical protein
MTDDPPDPEIEAVRECLRLLLSLDRYARARVLEYLDARVAAAATDEIAAAERGAT